MSHFIHTRWSGYALIGVLTILIFGGTYWWHTNMHCTSRRPELRCQHSGSFSRCREVQVCDDWVPNEPKPKPRPKRLKAERE